jgi:carboxyl-terminal processing protease
MQSDAQRGPLTGAGAPPTISLMRQVLRWTMLAVALSGPALAQSEPSQPSEADKTQLAAFGKAFTMARRYYVDPITAKALITRALHGLATAPILAAPEQKRIVAAASARVDATADDVLPLLRIFGDTVDALRATANGPAMDEMLRAGIAGMLDGLDSEAHFEPPPPSGDVVSDAGPGLKLITGVDGAIVAQAYFQGPAAKAGVRYGDEVISIDGHLTRGLPSNEAATLLRGPAGSAMTLLIRRSGASAPISIALTRAVVRSPLVSGRRFGSVAYFHVDAFAPGAAQLLHRVFTELQSKSSFPFTGIVLDLRGNNGGRLTEAVATADELLPPSTPIATTAGHEEGENQRFTAAVGDMTGGLPMVVLVDEATASGSEIVAAALQKGRGAVLIGSHTAGAGLVTAEIPVPPLGSMRLTTERIILVSGQPLKPPGLLPQVALAPWKGDSAGSPILEASSSDPMILRLRRGIPQTSQAGEPFDAPDAPRPDFEVRQACAAVAMLQLGTSSHP